MRRAERGPARCVAADQMGYSREGSAAKALGLPSASARVTFPLDPNARNSGAFVPGLGRVKGKVGFQTNTGTVRFRKIEIKELPGD